MKSGVKTGYRRQSRQDLCDRVECGERLGLVDRREIDELTQFPLDFHIDPDGLTKTLPAVHDTMTDRVRLAQLRIERLTYLDC